MALKPLSLTALQSLRSEFFKCPRNRLAQNACVQRDPLEVSVNRSRLEALQHVFTHKVEEVKPVVDQKSSGRCWNFAVHNAMRIPFMKTLNIEEFEFSQAYFFYWDKIERSYYFLNNIVETAKRGEDVNGRLVACLLGDPIGDGGQWDMIVSIINKHGVMPKKCFPESFSCESSGRMNAILKSKLREYAKQIRELFAESKGDESKIQALVDKQMAEIYNIVGICLGIPSETFTWEYYDKNKKYNSIGPVTPLEFYNKYVKPCFNIDDKVCLVTDPRPTNQFGKGYTVDCLGNVVGGQPVFYNNQPVDVLMDLVAKSVKAGEAVWFGCDVGARFARYQGGIEDLDILDYKTLFKCDVALGMNKAERLIYGDSLMTHAMVFTGVGTDDKGAITKFRVENSWGEGRGGEKGYLLMTAEWFREYGYEVVVDKKYVSADVMKVFNTTPVVLPAWDPMGSLAK